jgi:hypothetical protein
MITSSHPETYVNKQKLLRGVQGGGFLEKSPPGRRRQKGIFIVGKKTKDFFAFPFP